MGINSANGRLDKVEDFLKCEAKRNFDARFQEPTYRRASLASVPFKMLDEDYRDLLEGHFSVKELRTVICECVGDKSPGPNGFNLCF